MRLTTAHRSRPRRGETRSGDAVLVRAEAEIGLLAVVDALGHGPDAADVAERALAVLAAAPLKGGVRPIIEDLHRALSSTRGAAATVCLLRGDEFEAAGVGNVGLRAFGTRIGMLLSAGILGGRLRELRVCRARLCAHTRLIIYSDGVKGDSLHETPPGTLEDACDAILRRHGSREDDATILMADVA